MIEVGQYGRTNKGNIFIYANAADENNKPMGYIYERVKSKKYMNSYEWKKKWLQKDEYITKHSKDITDLIEEGDLIKYKLKNLQHYSYGIAHITKDLKSLEETLRIGIYKLESVEILEILTKEQYEANCCKIEEVNMKNNKEELVKLIQENPNLPLVFMMSNDEVAGDYGCTVMKEFTAYKSEIYEYEGFGDYVFSDNKAEVVEYFCDYFADEEKYSDLSQEEYEKVMENYVNQNIKHYEAIVIYAG